MSYFSISRGSAVTDFSSYYDSSSQVTIDLYERGLLHFYTQDLGVSEAAVTWRNGVIALNLDVLPLGMRAAERLLAINYARGLRDRITSARRCVLRFGNCVGKKAFHKLEDSYNAALQSMIPLMATANFVSTFVDPKDELMKSLLAHVPEVSVSMLMSQPQQTPVLRTLEIATLKLLSGRWTLGHYFRSAAFLNEMDPRLFYFQLEQIDGLIELIREQYSEPLVAYHQLLRQETERQERVRLGRGLAKTGTVDQALLQLLFASIDIEESRHYWQARFTRDAARCCLLLDLPMQTAGLDGIRDSLKGI
jgi:hypothetical protein